MSARGRRTGERGSGLVTSLMAVAVLGLLGASIYSVTRSQIRESVYELRSAQAQAIAEAGLEDALHSLYQNPGWRAGFSNKPFAGGFYTVTLSTDASPVISSVGYSSSIAHFGAASKTVRVQTRFQYSAASGGCAAQAKTSAAINGYVDAYDSASDPNGTSSGFGGGLCSYGSLATAAGLIRVNGNASYFSGSAPAAGTVAGTIAKSTYSASLPIHDGSAYVSANNNLKVVPISAYNSSTKDLTVAVGQTVTLSTGVYYFRNMTVNGTLAAATSSGTVTAYFTGKIQVSITGAITNASKLPARLQLYGQGAPSASAFKSLSPLYADVATPKALEIGQTLYGQAAADTFTLDAGAMLHYDKELGGSPNRVDWQPGTWKESY